jgi:hypothetical protein
VPPATPAVSNAAGDYRAQKALPARLDEGDLQLADVQDKTQKLFEAERTRLNSQIQRRRPLNSFCVTDPLNVQYFFAGAELISVD